MAIIKIGNPAIDLDAAEIPNLSANKITSDTLADARIPANALNSNIDLTNLSASNLTSGTVATARLGSGTADATTFLRGDNTFASATPADNSITLAKMASGTDGNIISYDTSGNPVAVATGSSGQVLTSAGTGAVPSFQTPAGSSMAPAFHAFLSSDQSKSEGTNSVIPCATEIYDTDNAYNTSNYRFTPQTAGKYFVYVQARGASTNNNLSDAELYIYKNTTLSGLISWNFQGNSINTATFNTTAVLDMNGSSDYIEAQMYLHTNGGQNYTIGGHSVRQITCFGAYKIIT
jgi:hypothetical protein